MPRIDIPETMTRQAVKGDLDRLFLIRFIANPAFAAAAVPHLKIECFTAAPARRILGWCKAYTTAHGGAIGKGIFAEYTDWVEREDPEPHEAEEINALLQSLSDEFDAEAASPDNPAYLLEKFTDFINRRQAIRIKEEISRAEATGDFETCFKEMSDWKKVIAEDERGSWNMLSNNGPVSRAFAEPLEPIITSWPSPADVFIGRACVRGGLIGIQAPEKRGKTFLCLEFMYRALLSRRKVAYFTCGDLTEEEVSLRFYTRICGLPVYEGEVTRPTGFLLKREGDDIIPEVRSETCSLRAIMKSDIPKGLRKFHGACAISPLKNYAEGKEYANNTASVATIDARIQRYEDETGFIPDVIIIDYMDILAPEPGTHRDEFRNRSNYTWQALRRLAQTRRALVVVPTQAAASAYTSVTQKADDYGNDKRKNGHVTGMLCINQTSNEKEQQIARLNWTFLRGAQFNEKTCLYVTQCIPLGIFLQHCALPPFPKND